MRNIGTWSWVDDCAVVTAEPIGIGDPIAVVAATMVFNEALPIDVHANRRLIEVVDLTQVATMIAPTWSRISNT